MKDPNNREPLPSLPLRYAVPAIIAGMLIAFFLTDRFLN